MGTNSPTSGTYLAFVMPSVSSPYVLYCTAVALTPVGTYEADLHVSHFAEKRPLERDPWATYLYLTSPVLRIGT